MAGKRCGVVTGGRHPRNGIRDIFSPAYLLFALYDHFTLSGFGADTIALVNVVAVLAAPGGILVVVRKESGQSVSQWVNGGGSRPTPLPPARRPLVGTCSVEPLYPGLSKRGGPAATSPLRGWGGWCGNIPGMEGGRPGTPLIENENRPHF